MSANGQDGAWVQLDGTRTPLNPGESLRELLRRLGGEDIWGADPVVLAVVDGRRVSLAERLLGGERIELMRLADPEAHSTTVRTLCSVLALAAAELLPRQRLVVDFSYDAGLYCELRDPATGEPAAPSAATLAELAARMRMLAERDLPFTPRAFAPQELARVLARTGHDAAGRAARYLRQDAVTLFRCEGSERLFHGLHLPTTAGVRAFDLRPEPPGFVLLPSAAGTPDEAAAFTPQPKLLATLREYSRWTERQGFADIGSINHFVVEGRAAELIQVEEARHARVVIETARQVAVLPESGRLVLVAGPSSSGKTSFAKRLALQLRELGFVPVALSLDDYFVPRDRTPRDEQGELDYESLAAIQLDAFNADLQALLAGEPVRLRQYDFHTGESSLRAATLQAGRGQPVIVEGIHALNPELTPAVPREAKLHVYVSALCHLNIDDLSYMPTTLTRLFRRIVRDARYRGYTASQTLARWPRVRAGERRWVFPHQQNADVFFNSGMVCELGVLKLWAEPRLMAVTPEDPHYGPARSLLELLTLALPIDAAQVPPTSLLREFIGGSGFHY